MWRSPESAKPCTSSANRRHQLFSIFRRTRCVVERASFHASLRRTDDGLLRYAVRARCFLFSISCMPGMLESNQSVCLRAAKPTVCIAASVICAAMRFQPSSTLTELWFSSRAERHVLSSSLFSLHFSAVQSSFLLAACRWTGGLIRRENLLLSRKWSVQHSAPRMALVVRTSCLSRFRTMQ